MLLGKTAPYVLSVSCVWQGFQGLLILAEFYTDIQLLFHKYCFEKSRQFHRNVPLQWRNEFYKGVIFAQHDSSIEYFTPKTYLE